MRPEETRPNFNTPVKIEDLGVPSGLVEELFARRLSVEKTSTIGAVSKRIHVSQTIGQQIAESLRGKKQLEYLGAEGRDYRIALTESGERRTNEAMRTASYVVPVPVPLEDYRFAVESQAVDVSLDREAIKAHLSDLVVSDEMIDQLGPAFLSRGAMFLYGPPGTGKTSLAERLGRFANDDILIPRIIEVDSQLISIFDPALHHENPVQPPGLDPRWVVCKRPVIIVGGELQMDSLDLQHDSLSGLHTAPLQMLANNGLLVVDDFGRQTAKPEQILNRWILPLSTGVDYLRGRSGTKFTVPFRLKLVVSTNLEPTDLGDDAFLRRLQNKIFVGAMDEEGFSWSLARAADRLGIRITSETASYIATISRKYLGELRPYIAVDFCEIASCILDYDQSEPVLTPEIIDRVAATYFVRDGTEPTSEDSTIYFDAPDFEQPAFEQPAEIETDDDAEVDNSAAFKPN